MGSRSAVQTGNDVGHLAGALRDGLEDLFRNVEEEAA